jgi:hypothetical protein
MVSNMTLGVEGYSDKISETRFTFLAIKTYVTGTSKTPVI